MVTFTLVVFFVVVFVVVTVSLVTSSLCDPGGSAGGAASAAVVVRAFLVISSLLRIESDGVVVSFGGVLFSFALVGLLDPSMMLSGFVPGVAASVAAVESIALFIALARRAFVVACAWC